MKVTTEKKDNHKLLLTIETPSDELTKAVQTACKRLANRVNIPGFRKGHAPKQILIRHLGKQAVLDEAFDILAPKAFNEALIQEKVEPVDRPQIDIKTLEEDKDVVFTATVTPKPEVTLGEYKNLSVEKPEVKVEDKDVDQQVENMRRHHANMTDAEAGAVAAKDNFVTLDFLGKVDGKAFKGGEAKDYPLQIGSGQFIPGFEDQLIGTKVGEEKDVKVKFPADYHEKELAGKDAVFSCKINSIKIQELPELTDEFVKKSTSYKSIDDLKKGLRDNMEKQAKARADEEYKNKVLQKVTENGTVDIPDVMIDERVNNMLSELALNLENSGMKMDQYLKYSNTDIASLRENYRQIAEETVKTDLVLEKIAKTENIKVSDKELSAEIAMMAARYGTTPKEVKKIVEQNGYINKLYQTVERKKAAQLVMDNLAK